MVLHSYTTTIYTTKFVYKKIITSFGEVLGALEELALVSFIIAFLGGY